jgi:hypothetical protein
MPVVQERAIRAARAHDQGKRELRSPIGVFKGVSVRIIRAIGRTTARPNAYPVKPRLDVAACPHPAPSLLGLTLHIIVLSF